MCKYFLTACVAVLCATDCSFAMQKNAGCQESNNSSLSNEDFISKQKDVLVSRVGVFMDEKDEKYMPKLMRIMFDYVDKKGQQALAEKIEQFDKPSYPYKTMTEFFIDSLMPELDECFVDEQIEKILERFGASLTELANDNKWKDLKSEMVYFVEMRGRKALLQVIKRLENWTSPADTIKEFFDKKREWENTHFFDGHTEDTSDDD